MTNELTKGIRFGVIADAFAPQGGNVGGRGFNVIYAPRGEQPREAQMSTGQKFTFQPGEKMAYAPDVGTINILNEQKIVPKT